MSRHGYSDDIEDSLALGRWRAQVASAIRGKRGQEFLKELAKEMDAMPVKELIAERLIDSHGNCCTIGVVCKARGIDVSEINETDPYDVGAAVGIAHQMAEEIAFVNDDWSETPECRWKRMREWVESQIKAEDP
jgi:hypothetical protein